MVSSLSFPSPYIPATAEVYPEFCGAGGPFYDPPYGTRVEDELAWQLVKYLKSQSHFHSQVQVSTPCGSFSLDIVLEYQGRFICIECGSADDEIEDRFRDAIVMGSASFDALYRFRIEDISCHMDDLLFLLSSWHPELFTDRARANLTHLASSETIAFERPCRGARLVLTYKDGNSPVQFKRLRLNCATDWVRDHDAALSMFSCRMQMSA